MAVHYLEKAALTDLPAGKKLVFMCIADSANAHDRVGFPGFTAMQKWSNLNRTRVYEVLAELVDDGWIARARAGGFGRRAEYVVFPSGCCAEHPALDGYPARRTDRADAGSAGADPGDGGHPVDGEAVASGAADPGVELQGPVQGPPQSGPLPNSPSSPSRAMPTSVDGPSSPQTGSPQQGTTAARRPPAQLGGPGHQQWEEVRAELAQRPRRRA